MILLMILKFRVEKKSPIAYIVIGDFLMASKDDFKLFASKHPELVRYIKSGEATWQKFYEIYDIYGEEESAWQSYFTNQTSNNDYNFKSITDKIKNIDLSQVQEHITTAQKALGIVQELTGKGSAATSAAATEVIHPRPINKIFED